MKQKNNGFTIIEVVLVLAVAGLIFLAVFVALPTLQRGQRDEQRRSDAARFVSQLTSYATNNNGSLPADSNVGTFLSNYMTSSTEGFKDPQTGNNYTVTVPGSTNSSPSTIGQFYYKRGATCNGESIVFGSNNRQAAIAIKLESGGVYCQTVQR